MHRLLLSLLALAATAAALALAPSSAVAARKDCGAYAGKGGPFAVRVLAGSVSCPTAKRITRRYVTSKRSCGGNSCARRIEGWWCAYASASQFPRLLRQGPADGRRVLARWMSRVAARAGETLASRRVAN